jgi:hypothetical protein
VPDRAHQPRECKRDQHDQRRHIDADDLGDEQHNGNGEDAESAISKVMYVLIMSRRFETAISKVKGLSQLQRAALLVAVKPFDLYFKTVLDAFGLLVLILHLHFEDQVRMEYPGRVPALPCFKITCPLSSFSAI